MITNVKFIKVWAHMYCKMLYQHLPGVTEKDYKYLRKDR